jgi:hypothetical protein
VLEVRHFRELCCRVRPPNGYFPISPWAGLAVLAGYTAVALGAAAWLLRRRDA